jgi:hypothetical protein
MRQLNLYLKIKRLLKSYYEEVLLQLTFWEFKKYLTSRNDVMAIFDLDNTLLNTYPFLGETDKEQMYLTLPAHEGMISIFKQYLSEGKDVVVISARSYRYKGATFKWFNENLQRNDIPIFLVPSASSKLNFLKVAVKKREKVIYFDDLSYNHENGEVKFYENIIEEVRKLDLVYFDFDFIKKTNIDSYGK